MSQQTLYCKDYASSEDFQFWRYFSINKRIDAAYVSKFAILNNFTVIG
ncbi:hypothetical protein T03_8291 [Trichinella britovi]|uniref:Uncharacterized protein n=1 Tax=Trichinella britovi TaxID=45882 RepID=A0A0V0Z4K2_TRIBR|nr:hypothetical protein T03_8291 [Trichinella britovi]